MTPLPCLLLAICWLGIKSERELEDFSGTEGPSARRETPERLQQSLYCIMDIDFDAVIANKSIFSFWYRSRGRYAYKCIDIRPRVTSLTKSQVRAHCQPLPKRVVMNFRRTGQSFPPGLKRRILFSIIHESRVTDGFNINGRR